jgi:hypothetical protein
MQGNFSSLDVITEMMIFDVLEYSLWLRGVRQKSDPRVR